MKKSLRKLIPTFVMLVITAALIGTSTFAWFSMNTSVTVTGMQLQVKSDNTFLLVGTGNDDTAAEIQTAGEYELDFEMAATKVYASHPASTAEEAALLNTTNGKKVGGDAITVAGAVVEDAATAAAVTNWYTATGATVNDEAMLTGSARQLTAFTNYVIVKTLYLTVAAGANNANNLSVTATITAADAGDDAIRVMVVTDNGGFAILKTGSLTADIKGLNTAITSSTVRTVTLYLYVDGEDASIYTNNSTHLDNATIGLSFSVDAVAAA